MEIKTEMMKMNKLINALLVTSLFASVANAQLPFSDLSGCEQHYNACQHTAAAADDTYATCADEVNRRSAAQFLIGGTGLVRYQRFGLQRPCVWGSGCSLPQFANLGECKNAYQACVTQIETIEQHTSACMEFTAFMRRTFENSPDRELLETITQRLTVFGPTT